MNTEHKIPHNRQNIPPSLVLKAFFIFFLLIMSYYILKPIRESLAIEVGSKNIPTLNILSMLSLIVGNAIYSWLVGKLGPKRFIPIISSFFVLCLFIFWITFYTVFVKDFNFTYKVIYVASYYLWVNLFVVYAVTIFWSYINDVISHDEGKQNYDKIGYGGLVGGLVGGLLTTQVAQRVGTGNLFIIAAFCLLPLVFLPKIISKNSIHSCKACDIQQNINITESINFEGDSSKNDTDFANPSPIDGIKYALSSVIMICLTLETFCYTFGNSLFSYQLNKLVEDSMQNLDIRTVFWAKLYNAINGFSIITQLLLTTNILRLKVPIWGLLILPISQIIGSLYLMNNNLLIVASSIVVFRYATNYSTGRVLRELMYSLTSRREKYQGKSFIETLVFRAGDGLASVLLTFGFKIFNNESWIDISIIFAMIIAIIVITLLSINYQKTVMKIENNSVAIQYSS